MRRAWRLARVCWPRWLRWGPAAAPGRPIHAGQVLGETLAGGGRYLLAAAGTGAAVVNVDAALAGRPALARLLRSAGFPARWRPNRAGARSWSPTSLPGRSSW